MQSTCNINSQEMNVDHLALQANALLTGLKTTAPVRLIERGINSGYETNEATTT